MRPVHHECTITAAANGTDCHFFFTLNNNNNNNLFIYSALFNMLGDQKRITTINNLKTINTNGLLNHMPFEN